MIYIRKYSEHDEKREINFPQEISLGLFDFSITNRDPAKTIRFRYCDGEKNGDQKNDVDVRLSRPPSKSEARIDAKLRQFLKKINVDVNDFLVVKRVSDTASRFFVVRQKDPLYTLYNKIMDSDGFGKEKGKNTHLCIPELLSERPYNWIVFGAPGTGKSHKLQAEWNSLTKTDLSLVSENEKNPSEYFALGFKYGEEILDEENITKLKAEKKKIIDLGVKAKKILCDDENCSDKGCSRMERVTFHPSYSFAQFVGTYKPIMTDAAEEEIIDEKKTEGEKQKKEIISYKYVPGPFLRTYVKAKKNPDAIILLLIEEINRANVAAVFGDVFQLLDRENGVSEYPIAASEDVKKYLELEKVDDYEKLEIPNNMYIWATMNSADQGVFPMDTAFKRRWDFEYIDIDHDDEVIQDFLIPMNDFGPEKKRTGTNFVRWNILRKKINRRLTDIGINEDKLMGPFFISIESLKKIDDLIKRAKIKLEKGDSIENLDVYQVEINSVPEKMRKTFETIIESFRNVFCSKVLMYLFEDAARMHKKELFGDDKLRFSSIRDSYNSKGLEVFNFGTTIEKDI